MLWCTWPFLAVTNDLWILATVKDKRETLSSAVFEGVHLLNSSSTVEIKTAVNVCN